MTYGRYQSVLNELGLNRQEGLVYEVLLQSGALRAAEIVRRSKLTRTNVYNILNSLDGKNLVAVDRSAKQLVYSAIHPAGLATLLDDKFAELSNTKRQFESMLKDMVGDFMLGMLRPGVVAFDGLSGVMRAYDDLLLDRLPLQSIQDMAKLDRSLAEYNPRFIKERVRRRLRHRLIAPESTREFNSRQVQPLRELRYLPDDLFVWNIDLKVTEKKLVLTTFMSESLVGIVVVHPDITKSVLSLFDTLWSGASTSA